MNTRGSINVVGATAGAAVLIATAGYFIVSEQVYVPVISPMITNTETNTSTDTTPEDQTSPQTPPPTPPASQMFAAGIRDVKYFYDTVKVPEEGYVRSGYKNEVIVRGKLVAIKPEVLCQSTPCPQPDSSQYRFVIENAQEYIQNSKYRISIKATRDPIARSLKEGQVYVFRGTLEHMFNDTDKVSFTFTPKSVE